MSLGVYCIPEYHSCSSFSDLVVATNLKSCDNQKWQLNLKPPLNFPELITLSIFSPSELSLLTFYSLVLVSLFSTYPFWDCQGGPSTPVHCQSHTSSPPSFVSRFLPFPSLVSLALPTPLPLSSSHYNIPSIEIVKPPILVHANSLLCTTPFHGIRKVPC